LASIAFGKGSVGPVLQWYLRVDSLGMPVARKPGILGTTLANFVFAPPPAPLDSTLAVGGVPSARSLLRVAFPKFIRDSSQIIRGTLFLVPAVAARGAPADSFVMEARTVLADFGRKSPIDARLDDPIVIHPGATDTIKIEVTSMLQLWAADTTHPTVFPVRSRSSGGAFAPFDALSPLMEAPLADISQLTATAAGGTSHRDAQLGDTITKLRATRFPLMGVAGRVAPRLVISGGFTTYLDRSWDVTLRDSTVLRGELERYRDEIT